MTRLATFTLLTALVAVGGCYGSISIEYIDTCAAFCGSHGGMERVVRFAGDTQCWCDDDTYRRLVKLDDTELMVVTRIEERNRE